jgi:hypothetical protein
MTDADPARADRARRQRIAARHNQGAREGFHLPSVTELIGGMSWFAGDICADAAAYAERVMSRIDVERPCGARLYECLAAFTTSPTPLDFAAAADAALDAADTMREGSGGVRYRGPDIESLGARLDVYAASTGAAAACLRVAAHAGRLAIGASENDMAAAFAEAALGWLAAAAHTSGMARRLFERAIPFADTRAHAESSGSALATVIIKRHKEALADKAAASAAEATPPPAVRGVGRRKFPEAVLNNASPAWDPDCDLRAGVRQPWEEAETEAWNEQPPGTVVVDAIGSPDTTEGKVVSKIFADVTGKWLPYRLSPDAREVRAALLEEFPHAAGVVDAILKDLVSDKPVKLRPIILVGEPGGGKTSMALRFFRLLEIPCEAYPCSASSDNSLGGTARRWTSGEPSLPLGLIRRHKVPNVGVVLDEIEKCASGGHNGSARDALLGMLEPTSARCWHDPYVQAAVELSGVLWLGTANSVDGIPAALRDRFRILRFPSPGIEHLPYLAASLMREAVRERGLDDGWAEPLAAWELDALAEHWRGGSIRRLGRLVEGVIAARERAYARA